MMRLGLLGLGLTRGSGGGGSPPVAASIKHLVMYGQSLALGTDPDGASVVSSASTVHKMLNAGTRPHYDQLGTGDNVNTPIDPDGCASFVALAEAISSSSTDFGETMFSGMGLKLSDQHLFTSTARGAYSIEELSRFANSSSSNQNHFHNTHAVMLYASELAEVAGLTYSIPAFGWKQGEADTSDLTTRGEYKTALNDMITHLRQAAEAAGHISDGSAIPLMTDQLAFRLDVYEAGSGDASTGYGALAVAVLEMHRAGQLVVVGPTYDAEFTGVDDVHFSSVGYREHGERWGLALAAVENGGWDPCHITGQSRSGTTITLTVHVPVAPLVVDSTTFASRSFSDDGFEYTGANITSVSITDTGVGDNIGTIEIELDASAAGTLRYAYENSGTDFRNLVGGHIRDSSTEVTAYSGKNLWNWLCTDEWIVA